MSTDAAGVPGVAEPRRARIGWLVALLAVLPAAATLGAPWIAEDASILGRVASEGALGDWFGPQYGLRHVVRFWRPVVTTSWWLGESVGGIAPLPLRAVNLLLHAGVALVLLRLMRALGVAPAGAFLAACAAALFPHQGGTVTWLAGRTDLFVGLGMLLAVLAVLRGRPGRAALWTLFACASKEFAFALPLWTAAALWATPAPRASAVSAGTRDARGHAALAVLVATGLAFLWRAWALGAWDGGYAGGAGRFLEQLPRALPALVGSSGALVLVGAGLWLVAALTGGGSARLLLAGWAAALAAFLPLVPLAGDGPLEPQNLRLGFVPELGLCLALGAAWAGPRAPRPSWAPRLLLIGGVALLGLRGSVAWRDAQAWAQSARHGEALIAATRAELADARPHSLPVLRSGLPNTHGDAYCLGLGVADRFRTPFPPSPRPVWPLRPLFELAGGTERHGKRPDGDLLWPERAAPAADVLEVRLVPGAPDPPLGAGERPTLRVDERVLHGGPDASARILLRIDGARRAAWLEAAVYTELGHGSATLRPLATVVGGPVEEQLSLRAVLDGAGPVASVGQMLMHAADLGRAREAFLELRLVDEGGALVASTDWIRLVWSDDLLERVLASAARPAR